MDETVQTEETASDLSNTPTEETSGGFDQDAQGAIPTQAQQEDTFLTGTPNLDPSKLDPALQPIYKKMQGAYTKKMQAAARWREQAELVDRFNNDRDFGFQSVAQWAARNGYSIAPVGQQPQQPQAYQKPGQVSPQIIEVFKAHLPPELQWMAESTAPALQTAVQEMLKPLTQQIIQTSQVAQKQQAEQEYDRLAQELSDSNPGWEEYEDEMAELLDFMMNQQQMRHPRFGSKHQLLYNLVTSNANATAQVTKRMNAAVKNRPSSGVVTGRTVNNIADRIRQAKSSQDAFKLAVQAAEQAGSR